MKVGWRPIPEVFHAITFYSSQQVLYTGGGRDTFMTQKRRRTTKTLTCGWSHADERPRPGGAGDPEILVQVKLSNRELIHSRGISCQKGQTHINIITWFLFNNTAVCTLPLIVRPERKIQRKKLPKLQVMSSLSSLPKLRQKNDTCLLKRVTEFTCQSKRPHESYNKTVQYSYHEQGN